MPLLELSDLKSALGIPTGITADDVLLQIVLDAAETHVLALTRYSLTAAAGREDIFRGVQTGQRLVTSLRPITVTSVQVRLTPTSDWVAADYWVESAQDGRVVLASAGAVWPPVEYTLGPVWEQVLDAARIVYDVSALTTVPAALRQAALHLAVHWHERRQAGAALSAAVGDVREDYDPGDVPAVVHELLRPYRTEVSLWA